MTSRADIILHIGAAKSGSSALQSALSRNPVLTAADGRILRYYGVGSLRAVSFPVSGSLVTQQANASAYGYASFPDFVPGDMPADLAKNLKASFDRSLRGNHTGILSNEGWAAHPHAFDAFVQKVVPNARVEALAFLRPPVDWLNAAFWQWGVWGTRDIDRWLTQAGGAYVFPHLLPMWAKIPNLRLRVFPARPNVVTRFEALYDVSLSQRAEKNGASPPSLLGFLLRNRRFRPDGHTAAVEFVFQRWCPRTAEPSPWIIAPRHIRQLRPLVQRTQTWLETALPADLLAEFKEDSRWWHEQPYLKRANYGPTPLDNLEDLPGLYAALAQGIDRVAQALGHKAPDLPQDPAGAAGLADWDKVVAHALEVLLAQDARWRRRQGGMWRRLSLAKAYLQRQ